MDEDADFCPETFKYTGTVHKSVAGEHLWEIRRNLTDGNRIYEVRQCIKCHQMRDETRAVTLDDVNEVVLRYRSVRQRIEVEIAAKKAELAREKRVADRHMQGFLESEELLDGK